MQPTMIVCIGRIFSESVAETESANQFVRYMELLANIVTEKKLESLRENTEWLFVPALDDPGQIRMFPAMPYADYLIAPLVQAKFRSVRSVPNPTRISFLGKEIVISRFNYLKKIKQNHLSKIGFVQSKYLTSNPDVPRVEDTYRLAKTILK